MCEWDVHVAPQRSGVNVSCLPPLPSPFLRKGLFLSLGLVNLSFLTGLLAPGILLFLTPRLGAHFTMPAFIQVRGIQTQILMLAQKMLFPLSHLPSLHRNQHLLQCSS